jgi:hypothetical protein
MSAPITEAHRKLACDVLLDHSVSGAATKDGVIAAAQWIADSEARAVQTAMLREYGNLCATNEGLAKERDQLRAERDWLKTWQDQAETNYVIGEPLAKKLRDTEAEAEDLRGRLAQDHGIIAGMEEGANELNEVNDSLVLLLRRTSRRLPPFDPLRVQAVDYLKRIGQAGNELRGVTAIDAAMKEGAK